MDKTDNIQSTSPDPIRQLAHDIRTPLTSIVGFAELLLEDDSIQGDSREFVMIIAAEAAKLTAFTDKFLRRAQPGNGE